VIIPHYQNVYSINYSPQLRRFYLTLVEMKMVESRKVRCLWPKGI
jgi:hypothetical protein